MNYWEVLRRFSVYETPEEELEDPEAGGEDPEGAGGGGSTTGDVTLESGDRLPRNVLPEDLRDRPENEVRFLLNRMAEGVRSKNEEVSELREQLAELRGRVEGSEARREPQEPDPYDEMSDEELMIENPDQAVLRILRRNGLIEEFDNVQSRLDETEFTLVASKIDDFSEYEEDVREILKESGARPTRKNILGAYTMAVGQRALAERQKRARKSASMEESKPEEKEGKSSLPELTGLERDIFESSGMTREEWEEYRADKPIDVQVPTG